MIDEGVRPFLPRYIAAFQKRPPVRDDLPPECVFLFIDPASGGKCEFAILGACFRGEVMEVRVYSPVLCRRCRCSCSSTSRWRTRLPLG